MSALMSFSIEGIVNELNSELFPLTKTDNEKPLSSLMTGYLEACCRAESTWYPYRLIKMGLKPEPPERLLEKLVNETACLFGSDQDTISMALFDGIIDNGFFNQITQALVRQVKQKPWIIFRIEYDEEYKEITVFEGEDYRLADWLSLSLEEANEDVDNLDELGHIKRKSLLDLLNVAGSEAAPKGYIK